MFSTNNSTDVHAVVAQNPKSALMQLRSGDSVQMTFRNGRIAGVTKIAPVIPVPGRYPRAILDETEGKRFTVHLLFIQKPGVEAILVDVHRGKKQVMRREMTVATVTDANEVVGGYTITVWDQAAQFSYRAATPLIMFGCLPREFASQKGWKMGVSSFVLHEGNAPDVMRAPHVRDFVDRCGAALNLNVLYEEDDASAAPAAGAGARAAAAATPSSSSASSA